MMKLILTLTLVFSMFLGSLESIGHCLSESGVTTIEACQDDSGMNFQIQSPSSDDTDSSSSSQSDHVSCHHGHCHDVFFVEEIKAENLIDLVSFAKTKEPYQSVYLMGLMRPPIA